MLNEYVCQPQQQIRYCSENKFSFEFQCLPRKYFLFNYCFFIDCLLRTFLTVNLIQVVSKPEFNFINSSMFQNISIAAWDPGKFNSSLEDWLVYFSEYLFLSHNHTGDSYFFIRLSSPDFNLFENYKLFMERYPIADFHLVDPRSIWRLWAFLQRYSSVNIRWNPPSSGFIGEMRWI